MQLYLRALVCQSFGEEAAAIVVAVTVTAGSSCHRPPRGRCFFSQARRRSKIGFGRHFGHSFASGWDHHQPWVHSSASDRYRQRHFYA